MFNPDCKCCNDIQRGLFPFVAEYGGRYSIDREGSGTTEEDYIHFCPECGIAFDGIPAVILPPKHETVIVTPSKK